MFYALTQGLLETDGLAIDHVLRDIETLNQAAFEGTYEITAISFHAYAYLHDRYQLMPSGASFGDGYGPVIVSKDEITHDDLVDQPVIIPGELTTANLALKLWQPRVETQIAPFDEILDRVDRGEALAGVVIHEGQLTYKDMGLHLVQDLGVWWQSDTGGPLPLGCNGIRRDLPEELKLRLCDLLTDSIAYGLDNRDQAMEYASRYARGLEDDPERSDRFVSMYVNDWTRSYGLVGMEAVQTLLDRGHTAGILPERVEAEFIGSI